MVNVSNLGNVYVLETSQEVKIGLDEVWQFFSKPENLEKLTPKDMNFKITSGADEEMYAGQIITYRIKLFKWFVMNWVTEITHVEKLKMFVDEQRFGPYSFWHHTHSFIEQENSVLMKDKVVFKLPMGCIGKFIHFLFIRKKLENIFTHRYHVVQRIFS